MMLLVLQAFVLLIVPAGLFFLHHKVKWMKPIVMAYILGVFIGNVWPHVIDKQVSHEITGISIILAIPLLLFPTRFKDWLTQPRSMLLAYGIALCATVGAVAIGFMLFQDQLPELPLVAGMITGVYSGGTVNLNAIGYAFQVPDTMLLLLNGYDMALSGMYLLGIFLFGKPWVNRIRKQAFGNNAKVEIHDASPKLGGRKYLESLGWSLVILVVIAGISMAIFGALNELMLVFGVTIGGILLANLPVVQRNKAHMPTADYLMVLFGLSLGLQADVNELANGSIVLMQFFALVFALMLSIHYALCYLFKVDGYERIIASVAAVFGPPFIGPVANALDRPQLIPSGIVVALIGNAVGTYLGMLMVYLLK